MNTSMLPSLFSHMAWADRRTLDSLRAMREPPPQALDLFSHMLAAQHVWLRRIDSSAAAYEVWPKLSLEEAERLARANHEATRALSTISESELGRTVRYTNTSGQSFETPLSEILMHMTHHSMYHRGQIALLVRAAGGAPLSTDYIVFVRS